MNKSRSIFVLIMITVIIIVLSSCAEKVLENDGGTLPEKSSGKIYLYGEKHSVEDILDKEIELWGEYYNKKGMRHLFIENTYYTGEFLNIWMQSENNDILDALYDDWVGTASHSPTVKEFFMKIKNQYPETIFHGTDIGHQYDTTGKRFLEYLENNKLEDTDKYTLTKEAIAQGKSFYKDRDFAYRENKMVENFIRAFDKLGNEDIMGIYGRAHTGLKEMDTTGSVLSMAGQLKVRYGESIYSEDLSPLAKIKEPYRVDTISIGKKDYNAFFFGKQDLEGFKDYSYREFWQLENAYGDFVHWKKTQDVLPYSNYPMVIEEKQIFVIDYTKINGKVIRKYYRSNGHLWNNKPSTQEIIIEQ